MPIQLYHLERLNNPLRKTAISFNCLAKLGAVTRTELSECRHVLRGMIERSMRGSRITGPVLVVGMVESGVILSSLMHQEAQSLGIDTFWMCSTRRPASGVQVMELHSHAPHHILPLPDVHIEEIWIVEDEITTGRTILQVAQMLTEALGARKVRIFALADIRTPQQQRWFRESLESAHIWLSLHYVFRPANLVPHADPCVPEICPADSPLSIVTAHPKSADAWHLRCLRPALQVQREPSFQNDQPLSGSMLVIGEAMDLAVRMIQDNPGLTLHHVTRSPWRIDNKAIFDCLHIEPHFYLYNLSNADVPLTILADPIDTSSTTLLHAMLTEKGYDVTTIIPYV